MEEERFTILILSAEVGPLGVGGHSAMWHVDQKGSWGQCDKHAGCVLF